MDKRTEERNMTAKNKRERTLLLDPRTSQWGEVTEEGRTQRADDRRSSRQVRVGTAAPCQSPAQTDLFYPSFPHLYILGIKSTNHKTNIKATMLPILDLTRGSFSEGPSRRPGFHQNWHDIVIVTRLTISVPFEGDSSHFYFPLLIFFFLVGTKS